MCNTLFQPIGASALFSYANHLAWAKIVKMSRRRIRPMGARKTDHVWVGFLGDWKTTVDG